MAKHIFFHVGISKTGSTFLQQRVFPYVKNIEYIPTHKYRQISDEIKKVKNGPILVSREFDRQFEREVDIFTKHHKNVTPIIVFRQHDQYLASQYRRFIKNGFKGEVESFFDLENDILEELPLMENSLTKEQKDIKNKLFEELSLFPDLPDTN